VKVDPAVILAKLRAEDRPLVKIHTGPLEEIRELSPGAARANDYVEEWLSQPGHEAATDETPAQLERSYVETAELAYGMSWKYTDNDFEALELMRQVTYAQAVEGDESAKRFFPHVMTTDAFNAFGWQGKWYHYGCQSLDIDDKYAASLCATKIATSELEHVHLPWPCFLVRIPKFLQGLVVNGEEVRHILVNHVRHQGRVSLSSAPEQDLVTDHEVYRLHLLTPNKYRILPAKTLAQWAEPNPMKSYDEFRLVEVEYGEIDRRQLEVLGRLVLGAIIAMNDPKVHRRYGAIMPGHDPSIGSPRYGTDNKVVLHKFGRPVKVDARETIGAYVSGRTGHVTNVRTLVAGHWKWQPHGIKSTLRKWKHIECYWRGDEDAPRIIRPHVLTGEK